MSSPFPQTIIIAAYIYFVTTLGPRLMENRKPFDLKRPMIIYNLSIVAFSIYMIYEVREGVVCVCVCVCVCSLPVSIVVCLSEYVFYSFSCLVGRTATPMGVTSWITPVLLRLSGYVNGAHSSDCSFVAYDACSNLTLPYLSCFLILLDGMDLLAVLFLQVHWDAWHCKWASFVFGT